ncbi:helix-turn-helix domain-containing protein [Flavobacterium sp. ALJ2]|uniref:helix-turn-helix domain-containing protein n=1 Tax=Flavobacterium sp. ALJ2 TaxID=2786960 RepID=UPI00189C8B91|nr:helix-turn-helix domain-containing protein [Flavobacterium sp. ALJ2]MBF7093590.1 helix-turn-helix domain-containing protein [Flavobacterium sp. ALJ2]
MENIAVVTVSLTEWTDLKNTVQSIAKNVLELKSKEKKELLTPKEAMGVLNCSRNTLQAYIDKGFLEPVRMQSMKYSKILIKRSDIDYFIENKSIGNG